MKQIKPYEAENKEAQEYIMNNIDKFKLFLANEAKNNIKNNQYLEKPIYVDEVPEGIQETTDFWKVTEMLLDENYKRRKTILSKRQVPKLTTIDVIAYIHDIPWLQQWVDKYTEYKTSLDGQRTKDIVGITKFNYAIKHGLQPESDIEMDKKAHIR